MSGFEFYTRYIDIKEEEDRKIYSFHIEDIVFDKFYITKDLLDSIEPTILVNFLLMRFSDILDAVEKKGIRKWCK